MLTPEEYSDAHRDEVPFEYEGRAKHLYDYDPDLFQEDWREKRMKNKTYECDGGSIAIGTVDARVQIPNCWGDGKHTVSIMEYGETLPSETEFRGAVQGKHIKVYQYDCFTDEECKEKKNILFTLSGRFGIFAVQNSGDIILQRWE